MARPLRIEFPGALYHVTARGNRRDPIFVDDEDRAGFLAVLARALARFDARVLAYCLMDNHYHLVLYTARANLSLLMRQINGVYTQDFNRRHRKVGHVFQGRFKAIVVDREAYLLALCRYVELNPVRAGMVDRPQQWPWSSHQAHIGQRPPPAWLDTAGLHGFMLGRDLTSAQDQRAAASHYADWVAAAAPDARLWEVGLRQQIYLGDDAFVQRMQALASRPQVADRDIPKAQRRPAVTAMADWLKATGSVEEALFRGQREGGLTLTHMAAELGRTVSWASKAVARFERGHAAVRGTAAPQPAPMAAGPE